MLKIKGIGSDVPDFYTSPYLTRKITAIGFDPDNVRIKVEAECESFLDDDFVSLDTKWRSAIVLHMIGIAWGVFVLIGLLLSMCCDRSTNFYRLNGCGLCQGSYFACLLYTLCFSNGVPRSVVLW
jgi:hypothetical protein